METSNTGYITSRKNKRAAALAVNLDMLALLYNVPASLSHSSSWLLSTASVWEIPVPVTRYPECQGAALTVCVAHPEAVSLVARQGERMMDRILSRCPST